MRSLRDNGEKRVKVTNTLYIAALSIDQCCSAFAEVPQANTTRSTRETDTDKTTSCVTGYMQFICLRIADMACNKAGHTLSLDLRKFNNSQHSTAIAFT